MVAAIRRYGGTVVRCYGGMYGGTVVRCYGTYNANRQNRLAFRFITNTNVLIQLTYSFLYLPFFFYSRPLLRLTCRNSKDSKVYR